MAISDLNRVLLLISQVGDVDPLTGDPVLVGTQGSTGVIYQNADSLWRLHEAKLGLPFVGSSLFNYYFKRDAVGLVVGVLESRVDFSAVGTAMSVKLNQRILARQMQAERFKNEIVRLENRLAQLAPAMSVMMTQIEPIAPPIPGQNSSPLWAVGALQTWVPDAFDPRYSGSPYWPMNNNLNRVR